MGLLDDDFVPRFVPGKNKKKYYTAYNAYKTEEEKLAELNNLGHDVEPEDYSNSPHLNY
jgi:hypothetical protein